MAKYFIENGTDINRVNKKEILFYTNYVIMWIINMLIILLNMVLI